MCHDDDSRPPSPPVVGAVTEHGATTLTAGDGNEFLAYRAVPAEPNGRNVVILPDIRGLHPYYEALAVRFAEAGFHAVALDYFGRSAGLGDRHDGFDWETNIAVLAPEHIEADARAAAAYAQSLSTGPTFTLGFCYGGSASWRLAASDLELAGCIGFYGRPMRIADVEDRLRLPMLLLAAGADAATPVEEFRALDERLTASGVEHELYVYDGAPHSFFDRAFAEWTDACADAWVRILEFTARHG